jgi:hypothetical protein
LLLYFLAWAPQHVIIKDFFTFLAGRNGIPPLPKEIGKTAFLRVLLYTFLDKGPKNRSFCDNSQHSLDVISLISLKK